MGSKFKVGDRVRVYGGCEISNPGFFNGLDGTIESVGSRDGFDWAAVKLWYRLDGKFQQAGRGYELAIRADERAKMIEGAPGVTGYIHADGYILMDREGDRGPSPWSDGTLYAASLVNIRAIKGEK